MNLRVIWLLMAILVAACTTKETETPSESSDRPGEEVSEIQPPADSAIVPQDSLQETGPARKFGAYLRCNRLIQEGDTSYLVYIIAKDIRYNLDTIGYCEPITRSGYAEFDIPAKAIDACGGWFEEAGEYYYLMEEGLDLVVYHAWLKEEQTTNAYPYKEVHRLQLPEIEL